MMKVFFFSLLLLVFIFAQCSLCVDEKEGTFMTYFDVKGAPYNVTYDARSIIIGNQRTLLLAGVIHYPRSTPGMWPYLMQTAVSNGLNTIQTYVFWNFHEHDRYTYNFEDRANLALFLETAAQYGLFVNLRIGPYVDAEWSYGGLPVWLNGIPNISFRSYNTAWILEMYRFTGDILNYVNPYLAKNGGPIIIAQIENEYDYGDIAYVNWLGSIVSQFDVGIPWIMCNGESANNTIETCNACNCYDNGWVASHPVQYPGQPLMWTENEGWFQQWGQAKAIREPEDLAYSVAEFVASGGSYHCYYMWYGGNNYGNTGGSGITTMYADDVNLRSDGTPNEPKFTHLGTLHFLLQKYAPILLGQAIPAAQTIPWWNGNSFVNGTQQMAFTYSGRNGVGLTFLISQAPVPILTLFLNQNYTLAPNSVKILNQELQVLFDTSIINPNIPINNTIITNVTTQPFAFQSWTEPTNATNPVFNNVSIPTVANPTPFEQLNFTNDDTIYLWYRTNITLAFPFGTPIITVATRLANALHFFLGGVYLGEWADYSHDQGNITAYIAFNPAQFGEGVYLLEILSLTLGIDNGAGPNQFEYKGIVGPVVFMGTTLPGPWVHQQGLIGEFFQIYTQGGINTVPWQSTPVVNQPLTWYTTVFQLPSTINSDTNTNPLLLDVTGLGRGHAFFNGNDIGVYWTIDGACYDDPPCCCQQAQVNCFLPTQGLYHIPPDWVNPPGQNNTLTIFDDLGADDLSTVKIVQKIVTVAY